MIKHSDYTVLWLFPRGDFAAWQQFVGQKEAFDTYKEYQHAIGKAAKALREAGHKVRYCTASVAEVAQAMGDRPNTPDTRALVYASIVSGVDPDALCPEPTPELLARVLAASRITRRLAKRVVREAGGNGRAAEVDALLEQIETHPQRDTIEQLSEVIEMELRNET